MEVVEKWKLESGIMVVNNRQEQWRFKCKVINKVLVQIPGNWVTANRMHRLTFT